MGLGQGTQGQVYLLGGHELAVMAVVVVTGGSQQTLTIYTYLRWHLLRREET